MDRNETSGNMDQDNHESTYNAGERMDRTAQSGTGGAFEAGDSMNHESMQSDAHAAFDQQQEQAVSGSSSGDQMHSRGGMGGSMAGPAGTQGGAGMSQTETGGTLYSNDPNFTATGPLGGSESITGGMSSGGSMGGGAMSGPMGSGPGLGRTNLDSDLGGTAGMSGSPEQGIQHETAGGTRRMSNEDRETQG